MTRPTAEELIAALNLRPHPLEGGHFRETYRSVDTLPAACLPAGYRADRSVSTAIYYLLKADAFSEMHRLPTDEVFHFYLGDPVQMLQLFPNGTGRVVTLGTDVKAGQMPQLVVTRGVWQGSMVASGGAYALLGATVAPGFDYDDYEAGERDALVSSYPAFAHLIRTLTRDP